MAKRFHINDKGEVLPCDAWKQPCEYENDGHYESEDAGRNAYEEKMSEADEGKLKAVRKETNSAISETETQQALEKQMEDEIKNVTTAGILSTMALKDMDAALLATTLFKESQKCGLDENYIASSIDVAAILHGDQTRAVRAGFPRTPYVEHPLRNAVRLLRMGVSDKDILVAAVLHDTVEDSSAVFVEKYLKKTPGTEDENRKKLRYFIKRQYGAYTLDVVDAVTNPIPSPEEAKLSRSKKQENYRSHVREQIRANPGAYLVKFSDFIDNAGSLYHQDKPGNEQMVYNMAVKYKPLIKDFQKHAPTVKNYMSKEGHEKINYYLVQLEDRLQVIIDKYKPKR